MKFNERLKTYRQSLGTKVRQRDFSDMLGMEIDTYRIVEQTGKIGETAFKAMAPYFISAGELGLFLALLEEFASVDTEVMQRAVLASRWVYLPESPESNTKVIVSCIVENIKYVEEGRYSKPYETELGTESGGWEVSGLIGIITKGNPHVKIIAWQPMPEAAMNTNSGVAK